MQLNFHRLWIFLQVVETGGFSAAAQKLFMSQPSVSNQVRQLESGLGAILLDRSGSRVRPTAEGEALAEHARRLFLLADEAVLAVQQVQGLTAGRLAVGGTTTMGTYLLPPLLARFRKAHPDVGVDLFVGNTEQVSKRLLDGDIGLVVFAHRPDRSQLRYEEILTDRLILITPPEHPLAGKAISPEALVGERFLLREKGSGTRRLQTDALTRWGRDPDDTRQLETATDTAEVWGPETLKQSVYAGLGLSVISEHAVVHELREGRLGTATVTPPPGERKVVAGYRRDRLLSPAEQAFLEILRRTREWPPA